MTTALDADQRPHAEHDIDWQGAVEDVVWIPLPHRSGTLSEAAARRLLRCTPASFAQLVDLGLPSVDGPTGTLYDSHDIQNVGLASKSGRTEVELGMRLVLAFMQAPVQELLQPRRWHYRLRLESPVGVGAALLRSVYRPTPETTGGTLESCLLPDGRPAPVVDEFVKVPQRSEVAGTIVTSGSEQTIRSEQIRTVVFELLESGVRWQYMPESLSAEPHNALAHGIGNCQTLSAALRQRLAEAGVEAHAYHGWTITLSQLDHGWVEVVDDDGIVKWLDPSFSLLATVHGYGPQAFSDLVFGSALNRVVPTRAPLEEPLEADAGEGDSLSFTCHPAKDDGPSRRGRRAKSPRP